MCVVLRLHCVGQHVCGKGNNVSKYSMELLLVALRQEPGVGPVLLSAGRGPGPYLQSLCTVRTALAVCEQPAAPRGQQCSGQEPAGGGLGSPMQPPLLRRGRGSPCPGFVCWKPMVTFNTR